MYNWKTNKYKDRERNFPQVITIFSAPKYSDSYNNKGAIIKFEVSQWLIAEKCVRYPAIQVLQPSLLPPGIFERVYLEFAVFDGKSHQDVL